MVRRLLLTCWRSCCTHLSSSLALPSTIVCYLLFPAVSSLVSPLSFLYFHYFSSLLPSFLPPPPPPSLFPSLFLRSAQSSMQRELSEISLPPTPSHQQPSQKEKMGKKHSAGSLSLGRSKVLQSSSAVGEAVGGCGGGGCEGVRV